MSFRVTSPARDVVPGTVMHVLVHHELPKVLLELGIESQLGNRVRLR